MPGVETTGVEPVQIDLKPNVCVQFEPSSSFQGGLGSNCALGKTPMITAYSGKQCTGTSVSAGALPADHERGGCVETLVETGSGSVSVDVQSTKFQCI